MKVELIIDESTLQTRVVIYANALTNEVQHILSLLEDIGATAFITGSRDDRTYILRPDDVSMISVQNKTTLIYDLNGDQYCSKKRLYELYNQLGSGFMQISKSTAINLSMLRSVEPGFNGVMYLRLKNGLCDYISRKYLSELKKHLGI